MRKLNLIKALMIMVLLTQFNSLFAQKKLYNSTGKDGVYDTEKERIYFLEENGESVIIPDKVNTSEDTGNESAAFLSILPTAIDLAVGITTDFLEKRVKKFSYEYSASRVFFDARSKNVPDFVFERTYRKQGYNDDSVGLRLGFKAVQIPGVNGFVYSLVEMNLERSGAKTNTKNNKLDYTIEIDPTFLVNGEKKKIDVDPIAIKSVSFNGFEIEDMEYTTGVIPLTEGSVFLELEIKIIETNPVKVRAEKVLEFYKANKDSAVTIIKELLPEAKEESDEDVESEDEDDQEETQDPNAGTGNG